MTTAPTDETVPGRSETRWYLGFLVLTVILSFVSFPYTLGVLLTGPFAVWFAVRALYVTRKETQQFGFRLGTWIGLGILASTLLGGFAMLVLYPQYAEYTACTETALTHQAMLQCDRDLEANLLELQGRLEEQLILP